LVVVANDPALNHRPKPLDRVGVDCTNDVVASALADDLVREGAAEEPIAGVFIRIEQADLVRHGLMHEAVQGRGIGIFDHAGHGIALAVDGTNNGRLTGADPSRSAAALVAVPTGTTRTPNTQSRR